MVMNNHIHFFSCEENLHLIFFRSIEEILQAKLNYSHRLFLWYLQINREWEAV